MARLNQAGDLRYYPLFAVTLLALAIGWNLVAKAVAESAVLPAMYPEAGPLRVTNNDGTLSNGDKLRGWHNAAYFSTHIGLWMVGCVVAFVFLVRLWPAKNAAAIAELKEAIAKAKVSVVDK